jgi:hypothetical protein
LNWINNFNIKKSSFLSVKIMMDDQSMVFFFGGGAAAALENERI